MTDQLAFRPRIFYVGPATLGGDLPQDFSGSDWTATFDRARDLGFDTVLLGSPWEQGACGTPASWDRADSRFGATPLPQLLQQAAAEAAQRGLSLWVDLMVDRVAADSDLHREHDNWYRRVLDPMRDAIDPRRGREAREIAEVVLNGRDVPEGFAAYWQSLLGAWAQAGVSGVRLLGAYRLPAELWRTVLAGVRESHPAFRFTAWTPGSGPDALNDLRGAGFDGVYASLPWWDYRAPWLLEEHARLRAVAPVLAPVRDPLASALPMTAPVDHRALRRALWAAVALGDGILVPADACEDALAGDLQSANQQLASRTAAFDLPRQLTGPDAGVGALWRAAARPARDDARSPARTGTLTVFNADSERPAEVDWALLRARLPDDYAVIDVPEGVTTLDAADVLCVSARTLPAVRLLAKQNGAAAQRKRLALALDAPRVAIEAVTPAVDAGRFAVKRTVGRAVRVEADVVTDGHEKIGVALWWRPTDEADWREVPMRLINNDRYTASFTPERLGRHEYTVVAWRDEFATWRDELSKKVAAGIDVTVEVREGKQLVAHCLAAAGDRDASELRNLAARLGVEAKPLPRPSGKKKLPPAEPAEIELLLSDALADAIAPVEPRDFLLVHSPALPLLAERVGAGFASWYELFPRSQSNDVNRHGTFDDVIARLPAVRDMGFDVLYFTPIHPIGKAHRKGRNNSLTAGPDDPGSPYAIGSEVGGHDALHPELGTLDDFRRMSAAAREHGLELALDFAIQCSPDHPWLKEHPDWFAYRADGTIRYAENPPKKYEDIVNVDFYSTGTQPAEAAKTAASGLWVALRDVILHWAREGVRLFRVDNPHTKPLPFWEWMIAEVQAQYPDTVFLSEAFTRPKMMYRLAKLGFSQSYTYFTWRDTAPEMQAYLTELNQAPVSDFFRPHFFVNTPDINPRFLQTSGRAGFQIRAALAATLSGLWGVYNGFELCEATPVPGKEEYLDSEKYQLRAWDYDRPGNIVADITRLNQIRRANPALQTHLGVRFHKVDNDQVLVYSKATPERDNIVLVAVNMNPHAGQHVRIELPRWDFGLPNEAPLQVYDLIDGRHETWGEWHHAIYLDPSMPYAIWRVQPHA